MQGEISGPADVGLLDRSWRQGSVLQDSDTLSLGLINSLEEKHFAIVATHDCDCVAKEEDEPKLELIIGRQIAKEAYDGSLTHAKSTRKLHLEIAQQGIYIELSSATRTSVEKESLRGLSPSETWFLDVDQRRIFRRWLAARYDRVSFPDELAKRLKPVANHFKRVTKNDGAAIIGFYIQFEPDAELKSEDSQPYSFRITVVYDSSKVGALEAAQRIAGSLQEKFEKEFKTLETVSGTNWANIDLESCVAMSDFNFTLQDALSSYVYRLDDASLKLGEQGLIPPQ